VVPIKFSKRVPIFGIIVKAKAVEFNKLFGGHETFKASKGQLQR
jgi:hypothetical protein